MQILAITPIMVGADELARRQARYDRLAPAGVSVRLESLRAGPEALESAADIEASEEALVRQFAAASTDGVDAFLPDCVLDPVVEHAAALPRPVLGIGRLTAHFAAGFDTRVGAVARNTAIAAEVDRKLTSYAVGHVPTAVLDLSVDDIARHDRWAAAVERTVGALDCDIVINACSAVDLVTGESGQLLLDPTQVALRLAALWAEAGR